MVNAILVPVAGDDQALRGLSDQIDTQHRYASIHYGSLTQWMVIASFHCRRRLYREVREKLPEYFPDQIPATAVRATADLVESPGFHKTVCKYRDGDYGADDNRTLAQDFIMNRFMQ